MCVIYQPQKNRYGMHRAWVGLCGCLEGQGKYRIQQDSIPGPLRHSQLLYLLTYPVSPEMTYRSKSLLINNYTKVYDAAFIYIYSIHWIQHKSTISQDHCRMHQVSAACLRLQEQQQQELLVLLL